MKSVVQNLRNGDTTLADIPCPEPKAGEVLIASSLSLISAGTERMIVEFGKANPVQKALQQPEKVKQVIEKVRTDGLQSTVDAVKAKLDAPTLVGYCNVGIVVSVGPGVSSFKPGDRGFEGASGAEAGGAGGRGRPVEFEQEDEADPFGLDEFLDSAKEGQKK